MSRVVVRRIYSTGRAAARCGRGSNAEQCSYNAEPETAADVMAPSRGGGLGDPWVGNAFSGKLRRLPPELQRSDAIDEGDPERPRSHRPFRPSAIPSVRFERHASR